MQQEPVIWQKVEWRQGDGTYRFELNQGGMHATLTAPQGRSFTIPTVAWYALLDALAAARKTKQRSERALPARSNARWGETEVGDLAAAFKAGASIGALARSHNRSGPAIETQLSRLGLWDRLLERPREVFLPPAASGLRDAAAIADPRPSLPPSLPPWPPDDWDQAPPLTGDAVLQPNSDRKTPRGAAGSVAGQGQAVPVIGSGAPSG